MTRGRRYYAATFFRLERTDRGANVRLQYLFTSRAVIYMVRISWERLPLLLFSDVHSIGPISFQHFQNPTDGSFRKHNVQMGLPEGHSVLLHFFSQWDGVSSCTGVHEFCPLQGQKRRTRYVEACSTSVNRFCMAAGRCC